LFLLLEKEEERSKEERTSADAADLLDDKAVPALLLRGATAHRCCAIIVLVGW